MSSFRVYKKQFIAGAVCPSCNQVDRIVVEQATDGLDPAPLSAQIYTRRRCVTCDFADEFSIQSEVRTEGVPKGRPERPRVGLPSASVVRIIDLDNLKSK